MSKLIVEVTPILKIEPHPNADRMEVATVKGWQCLVGKGNHQPGELIVFVPPDAVLPDKLVEEQQLGFLKKGNRVETVKLRGFISQGLVLNTSVLPQGRYPEGTDVAELLGITKWEPPVAGEPNRGANQTKKRLSNPHFDKYTDIDNVKHYPDVFGEGEQVVITEKIHGANWRCGLLELGYQSQNPLTNLVIFFKKLFGQKYEFVYGSHNVQLQWFNKSHCFYKDNIYEKMVEQYGLKDILLEDMIIYGEVYGKGVQDLTYGMDGISLAVFDIKYKGKYMGYEELKTFCSMHRLPMAPELYVGPYSADLLAKYTPGQSVIAPLQIREGCVIRPLHETFNPKIGRKILKSISPDYLLRKGGTETH